MNLQSPVSETDALSIRPQGQPQKIVSSKELHIGTGGQGLYGEKEIHTDRDRTRTCNPQIRSLVPYPLGHTVLDKIGTLLSIPYISI